MNREETLLLKNQICFNLYATSRKITQHYKSLLDPLGLTYPQYLVMLVLWEKNEPTNIKFLCQKLLLDTGTLTPMLKKMETNGIIKRERSKTDERQVMIALTEQGQQLKIAALEVPTEVLKKLNLSIEEAKNIQQTITNFSTKF